MRHPALLGSQPRACVWRGAGRRRGRKGCADKGAATGAGAIAAATASPTPMRRRASSDGASSASPTPSLPHGAHRAAHPAYGWRGGHHRPQHGRQDRRAEDAGPGVPHGARWPVPTRRSRARLPSLRRCWPTWAAAGPGRWAFHLQRAHAARLAGACAGAGPILPGPPGRAGGERDPEQRDAAIATATLAWLAGQAGATLVTTHHTAVRVNREGVLRSVRGGEGDPGCGSLVGGGDL